MAGFFDTIVAPITAPGGAVGLVRLSGPRSLEIARLLCRFLPDEIESHKLYRVTFSNGDDGLLCFFAEGRSFTGEESVELHAHGSPIALRSLCEQAESAGARMARPGEFSERAFLNGKLDLSQAEAVNDTVRAMTERQLSLANAGRGSSLRGDVAEIRDLIATCLATIEASVDFSEEIGEVDIPTLKQRVSRARQLTQTLVERAKIGRLIRQGIRIAIVGPPNAGKSSLLNRLLGAQRAIVTEIAGTTRDFIEESCELAGLQCVLIDTAGLRDSDDFVESLGIQHSRLQAAQADLVWYVFDSSVGMTDTDEAEISRITAPVWRIAHKADLSSAPLSNEVMIPVSSYTGEGVQLLVQKLNHFVPVLDGAAPNERHFVALTEALEGLDQVLASADYHPPDLLVTHLRVAMNALGTITGETATEDMLERIFRDFCIGK